jgi:hypothetical protein
MSKSRPALISQVNSDKPGMRIRFLAVSGHHRTENLLFRQHGTIRTNQHVVIGIYRRYSSQSRLFKAPLKKSTCILSTSASVTLRSPWSDSKA